MALLPVLLVEDDADLSEAIVDTLTLADINVTAVSSAEAALKELPKHSYGLIISDVNMPGMDGHALLKQLQRDYHTIPVLLMTAFSKVDKAVEAIKNGAVDYLSKPFESDTLIKQVNKFCLKNQEDEGPIANDPASQSLFQLACKVASSTATTLITGESGTGKEVLARFIHDKSNRSKGPFVAINCAAIPENMLEATLFGYEKGAFTGAYKSTPGKFEIANGGTLLLDEVTEMPLALQPKLLRVLQEQEVERIGGNKTCALDVRIIATSNRNLVNYVKEGEFREDLYYRLNVFPLHWVPLRDRPMDIAPIAEHLIEKNAEKQKLKSKLTLSPGAIKKLSEHSWPGNVRELDNVIQRALILHVGEEILPEDIQLNLETSLPEKANSSTQKAKSE